jgi:hypothetical protein
MPLKQTFSRLTSPFPITTAEPLAIFISSKRRFRSEVKINWRTGLDLASYGIDNNQLKNTLFCPGGQGENPHKNSLVFKPSLMTCV